MTGMGLAEVAFAFLLIDGREIASGNFHWYRDEKGVSSISLLPPEKRILPPVSLGILKPCPWKLEDCGDHCEITVEMAPPEVTMVVIE